MGTHARPSLVWLAVAAFAIGTESYVVAGLLPDLAGDLHVSLAVAGQLITVFSLAYAFGSPLLAVLTGGMDRRRVLLGSLAAFGVFNLFAAASHSYGTLLGARIGLALTAGTFMPAASAYAVAVTTAARRGRALAVIYTGLTVATVIGVPAGVMVGSRFGWRATFGVVAALAFVAMVGLSAGLSPIGRGVRVPLRSRIQIARRPDVFGALLVTVLTLTGAFTLYAYVAPFLQQTAGLSGDTVAAVLFVFGAGSAVGNLASGSASDRFGPRRIITAVLVTLIGLFVTLSVAGSVLGPDQARWIIVPTMALWGLVGWSFPAAQQARIVAMEPKLAPITLSLNASAIYLGVSLGAFLGSIVVAHRSLTLLGFFAAASEVAALGVLFLTSRRRPRAPGEVDRLLEQPPAFEPAAIRGNALQNS